MFSLSHNLGEWLSFLFVGVLVSVAGWQWGFIGSSIAGALGVVVIVFSLQCGSLQVHLHSCISQDTPSTVGECSSCRSRKASRNLRYCAFGMGVGQTFPFGPLCPCIYLRSDELCSPCPLPFRRQLMGCQYHCDGPFRYLHRSADLLPRRSYGSGHRTT